MDERTEAELDRATARYRKPAAAAHGTGAPPGDVPHSPHPHARKRA
jgi:hypothetical protein